MNRGLQAMRLLLRWLSEFRAVLQTILSLLTALTVAGSTAITVYRQLMHDPLHHAMPDAYTRPQCVPPLRQPRHPRGTHYGEQNVSQPQASTDARCDALQHIDDNGSVY